MKEEKESKEGNGVLEKVRNVIRTVIRIEGQQAIGLEVRLDVIADAYLVVLRKGHTAVRSVVHITVSIRCFQPRDISTDLRIQAIPMAVRQLTIISFIVFILATSFLFTCFRFMNLMAVPCLASFLSIIIKGVVKVGRFVSIF